MAKGIGIPPYYDTFDGENNNSVRVLFRSGKAIQSRELNELQTIISEQIERFGRHVFKEGSPVTGGALSIANTTLVLVDAAEDVSYLVGKTIAFKNPGSEEAESIATVGAHTDATTTHPQVLAVSFITKEKPARGAVLVVDDIDTAITVADRDDAVHTGLMAALQNGVYFFGGRFVRVDEQTSIVAVLDPYVTGDIGLLWEEKIVTADSDPTLLDPALGSLNYGADGAHRLAVDTKIHFVGVGEKAPDNFVKLMEVEQGRAKTVPVRPVHAEIGKMLARRTWEESGDYTVDPYAASMNENFEIGALDVWVGPHGDRTNIRVRTGMPHGLSIGEEFGIINFPQFDVNGNPVDGLQDTMNDIFSVSLVVDDFTFEYIVPQEPTVETPEHIDCRAVSAPKIKVVPVDYMSLEISPGSAYVRGFEIDHHYKHVIRYQRARSTSTEDAIVAFPVGNTVKITNVTGYVDNWATVSLEDANGQQIATANAMNFRHYSGQFDQSGTWSLSLFNIKQSAGANSLDDVRVIMAPSFSADVASDSIINGKFVLGGTKASSLLYEVAYDVIKSMKPTASSPFDYVVWKKYTGVAAGGVVTFNTTGDDKFVGSTANFAGTDLWNKNYVLVNDTSLDIVDPSSAVVTTGYDGLVCNVPQDANYTLLAATSVSGSIRMKNETVVDVQVSNTNAVAGKVKLGFADAIAIEAAYDSGTVGQPATDSDRAITSSVLLYPNKTQWAYLESVVEFVVPPEGDVLLKVRRYDHSGDGPFVVDSYVGHRLEDIPVEQVNGNTYELARCVDWRPVVIGNVISGPVVAKGSQLVSAPEVYNNRADVVVMAPSGEISVMKGEPSLEGFRLPHAPEDTMKLFEITVPAYTASASQVGIKTIDNRRYTMRDIGMIDKRLGRVEYYTQLSLLEMRAKAEPVYDKDGRERFKNGFIVDDFSGDGPGWQESTEFRCTIVPDQNVCRPRYVIKNEMLETDGNAVHAEKHGEGMKAVYTLPYEETPLLANLNPTKKEFVTPYLVSKYIGKLELSPDVDDWYDDSHETKMVELEMDDIVVNQTIDVVTSRGTANVITET